LKANGRLAVDSNAVIAYREGISAICKLIERIDIVFLPVIVLGELRYGAINSAKPEKNEQDISKFSDNSVIMPIDEDVAIRYAKVRSELKKTGHPIPENDIWIAAICLELDVPLLSNDGHFQYVNGLEVINWQTNN
jgi:tRNA(fMet)-specific endonuclease VapC